MAMALQMVAGDGVKHTAAEEDGTDQQVEDVKHFCAPDLTARGRHASAGLTTRAPLTVPRTVVAAVQRPDIADRI
jgi:hypothetical protein